MSTGTWVAGKNCPLKFTPAGGSEATLQVTDSSWSEAIDKVDITHTGSAGVQALLATILRGSGNVKAFYDATSSSTYFHGTTVGIRVGTNGVLKVYVNGTLYYAVPCMVVKVNVRRPTAGGVEYDFDVELNSEAGSYAYPA